MKIKRGLICAAACAFFLGGCGQSRTQRPDLSELGEIHAVAREDGSGTREQFEELVGTDESGASYEASSTEEVVSVVEQNSAAVGYVAMSTLTDESNVTVLSVDGTELTTQNVQKKKYGLTRNYYLAWLGEQSELEQEFITYVRGAGQKIIAEEAVPVAKETSFLSLKPSGTIRISGSTSMTPMIQKLAQEYETYNPNAEIEVAESDSARGLLDVMQGKADLAMSSRELKEYEKELLSYKAIATDGIAVIVNTQNPIGDIGREELKDIYDGNTSTWQDLSNAG